MDGLGWSLLSPGDRVLVAVSGGPDSLSLLHTLHAGREEHGLADVQAAHLDHGLRGEESAREAEWVAAWCAECGIACHVGRADVADLAKTRKISKQQAARAARYEFLEETAERVGATKIATGHTQDDQVETVLLNVLRGAGLNGLRGIPAVRGPFVRPLLGVTHAEVEAYCDEHGLTPRRDPSNLSTGTYTRNKIRLELLPQLARDYNPAVGEALLRLSEIAGRDSDYLQGQAEEALTRMTRGRDAFRLVLDRPALAGLHPALLRYTFRAAIVSLRGTGEGITYDHVETACRAVAAPTPRTFLLNLPHPLCTVRITDEALTVTLANVPASLAYVSVPLPVAGSSSLPGTDWIVSAGFDAVPESVTLDADVVSPSGLTLRNWRQGDRIDPLGMGGRHKKVSDLFSDAKVPRAERHGVPLVSDDQGILWIVGHTIAERAKVTPETTRRLFLRAVRRDVSEEGNSVSAAERPGNGSVPSTE